MILWNPLNRAMLLAAGVSVLAACYAVAAWGQAGAAEAQRDRLLSSHPLPPTVTVASLRIPAAAWRHFERAKSAEEHHRDADFERESARALEIAPEFASMYLLRATVAMGERRYPAAVANAAAALKADPGALWATVVLAGAYNGMHRFEDALQVLNEGRGYEAESWQAMYERARAETGLGDADAALLWSGRALRSAPQECIDAHLVRANALLLVSRWSEAVAQMEAYLQSKASQAHRDAVVALLNEVRPRIEVEERDEVRLGIVPGHSPEPLLAAGLTLAR